MKQNFNTISLAKIFTENNLQGIGDDEGKLVREKLMSIIESHPEYNIFYVSVENVSFDASFAREAIIKTSLMLRKKKGLCIVDVDSESILINLLGPVVKLEQPLPFYMDGKIDFVHAGKNGVPSKTNQPIYELLLQSGSASAAYIADKLDMKLNNASTKLKSLYEEGFILREEDRADSGGIEYKYYAIK